MKKLAMLFVIVATQTMAFEKEINNLTVTTTSQAKSFDVTTSRNILLSAYGVIDYYQNNCAGLTRRGKQLTMKSLYKSDLYLLKASELTNTKAFKDGYTQASKFACNDLRWELFNIGARELFR